MHHITSSSSSVTPSHVISNGSTTQLPQSLRPQQDCHLDHVHHGAASGYGYVIKQSQVPECVESSSADNFPVLPFGYPQDTARAEIPSGYVAENGALSIAPTSITRYQDRAWTSPHAQANYPFSTSYADEDGQSSIIKGRPVKLLHHTAPVPITQVDIPFQNYHRDALLVNAVTPHYDGDAQDRVSAGTAYPSIALSSPNTSILLPRAVINPLGYPQDNDNGNVSKFGELSFAHRATTRPTTGLASAALFLPLSNTSRPASPNPVVPPLQDLYPSDHLDNENIPALVEWTASPAWFTKQPYLPPNQPIEIASTPTMPHIPLYTLPTPSQSNSNAQVVNLHASASIPLFPNPPLPLPSEFYMHNRPSDIGNSNLLIPAGPPVTDSLPSGIIIDRLEASQARGGTRACHQANMAGNSWATEPISTRRAGHFAKIQSWTRRRPFSVRPLPDRNVPTCCGWQDENGRRCGAPVTYNNCAEHFAAVHGIKDIAAEAEVLCCWCPLSAEKKVKRKKKNTRACEGGTFALSALEE